MRLKSDLFQKTLGEELEEMGLPFVLCGADVPAAQARLELDFTVYVLMTAGPWKLRELYEAVMKVLRRRIATPAIIADSMYRINTDRQRICFDSEAGGYMLDSTLEEVAIQ